MRKIVVLAVLFSGLLAAPVHAHFQMIIPSTDIISSADGKQLTLRLMFIHPMEGHAMDMAPPAAFGVFANGKDQDLLKSLKAVSYKGRKAFQASYAVKRPGDYIFHVQPCAYWEPAEGIQIVHYTKVVVNALGLEEGWDEELGQEIEIVPLVRPYGLWAGNLFSGIVKKNGKPLASAKIEVEYFNEDDSIKPAGDAFVTQVVKTDTNGVFSYAIPWPGWWGFAALSESERKMKNPEGKEVPVEIGGVIWIKATAVK